MLDLSETRHAYESSLEAHSRLLELLSKKYVELLEEEEEGGPAAKEHRAYLQERIDRIYYVWDWTRQQLKTIPVVKEAPAHLR